MSISCLDNVLKNLENLAVQRIDTGYFAHIEYYIIILGEFQVKNKWLMKVLPTVRRLAMTFVGAMLSAVAINSIIIPHGLLSSGIGGLALVGNYLLNIPVYIGMLVMNIPIFLLGIKELSKSTIIYSLIGAAILIIALPLTKPFLPTPELDLILAAIFSGIVFGAGIGIVIKSGGSTGGSDILSMIAKQKKNISVGVFNFYFNLVVIILSLLFFPLNIALYTMVSIWVAGKMTDAVIEGLNRNKSVTIISEKSTAIAERILTELKRGVTYLEGYGAFSNRPVKVIDCVVNHYEIAKLKQIVYEIDEGAFMFVTETVEVTGLGFKR